MKNCFSESRTKNKRTVYRILILGYRLDIVLKSMLGHRQRKDLIRSWICPRLLIIELRLGTCIRADFLYIVVLGKDIDGIYFLHIS